MPFRHPPALRLALVALVREGELPAHAARSVGVSATTAGAWLVRDAPELLRQRRPCCRCSEPSTPPDVAGAYAQLLGLYLGDGCVSAARRSWVLRITCDDAWPGVADEVGEVVGLVSGAAVTRVRKVGCHDLQAQWQHWPCLLPQHGRGKKHERAIALEPWQRAVVGEHAGRFLRGLFHSDGWRGDNVAVRRAPDGLVTRYRYTRYEFTNRSADIRGLCTDALDLIGVAWRPNGPWRISVNKRAATALLDEHVGPKH